MVKTLMIVCLAFLLPLSARDQKIYMGENGLGILPAGEDGAAARAFLLENHKAVGAGETDDYAVLEVVQDELGQTHVRLQRYLDGLEVVGDHIVLHMDAETRVVRGLTGKIVAPGTKPDLSRQNGTQALERAAARIGLEEYSHTTQAKLCYVLVDDRPVMAYMGEITYTDEVGPQRDQVFADVETGALLQRLPQHHYARNRNTYDAGGTSGLGTLVRNETSTPVADSCLNSAHDFAGIAYDYYSRVHGRDSYDNAGATIQSTVHYGVNYANAFFNGSSFIYGDGDKTAITGTSLDMDVTVHEFTHAVNAYTANLIYSGESGALSEALSDIFAACADAWISGGPNAGTWKIGEKIVLSGFPGGAFRFLNDPALNGTAIDCYSSLSGSVHNDAGIGSLAFYLLSQGGVHPRGATTNVVSGIGYKAACAIFYRAWTLYSTPTTNYAGFCAATQLAAIDLHGAGSNEALQTANAWAAVCLCSTGVNLVYPGLSGAAGSWNHNNFVLPAGVCAFTASISGGTGDADLYTNFGVLPTTASYNCRPYVSGNNEACSHPHPSAGVWYASLRGYAAYSGVTLTVTY